MRLDAARLCLDCEEIHEDRECPSCGSEAFAFLTRWVHSSSERRPVERRPVEQPPQNLHIQPRTPEQIEAYRQIVEGKPAAAGARGRLITGSVLGVAAAVGLAGWAWKVAGRARGDESKDDAGSSTPQPVK